MDTFVQNKLKEWKLESLEKSFNGKSVSVCYDSNLNFG